jgi:hypothetical protein
MEQERICGRPTYPAPPNTDPEPVCLMHSHDPDKATVLFLEEMEAILDGTSRYNPKDKSDFTRFVFPLANFRSHEFTLHAIFEGATFSQAANFFEATFNQAADFEGATFTQVVDFRRVTFTRPADFHEATFNQAADFRHTTFTQAAIFLEATFDQAVDFRWSTFTQDATFHGATFNQAADFRAVTFVKEADFRAAAFTQAVDFFRATFTLAAYFNHATFTQSANFTQVTFTRRADFYLATFHQAASFKWVTFTQDARFPSATFRQAVDFYGATFQQPAQAVFKQVNKKESSGLRACFVNCEVEAVKFIDVHWHRYEGRMVLQDELDITSGESTDYGLVAVAYRQLVNNFEKNRNYSLAEDCFIGAMEMTRLNPANFLLARWPPAKKFYENHMWARKLGEWFSVLNLYRLLSKYGSSYTRALGVLGVMFLALVLLFPWLGLRMAESASAEPAATRASVICPDEAPISWCRAWNHDDRATELWRTFRSGVLTVAEVATFQRGRLIEPATTWGRGLAIVATILIPGQLALLFLALRRRFRR